MHSLKQNKPFSLFVSYSFSLCGGHCDTSSVLLLMLCVCAYACVFRLTEIRGRIRQITEEIHQLDQDESQSNTSLYLPGSYAFLVV